LAQAGITVSMSRTGTCSDNAVTEAFFATLKGEGGERAYLQTRKEAKQTIFEEVACFSNRLRRPASLGSISPVAYEQVTCSPQCFGLPQKWVNLSHCHAQHLLKQISYSDYLAVVDAVGVSLFITTYRSLETL
jgi:integrase-like protein